MNSLSVLVSVPGWLSRRSVAGLLLLASVGGFLSACEPARYATTQDRIYSPAEFRYASANKDFRTVISGNPFSAPDAQLESVVLEAMQPRNWGFDQAYTPRTRFTTRPNESANEDYRVEVSFLAEDVGNVTSLCAGQPGRAAAAEDGVIRARMAFCFQTQILSTTVGTLTDADGVRDPRFRRLIVGMTRDLFPHREFREGDSRRLNRLN